MTIFAVENWIGVFSLYTEAYKYTYIGVLRHFLHIFFQVVKFVCISQSKGDSFCYLFEINYVQLFVVRMFFLVLVGIDFDANKTMIIIIRKEKKIFKKFTQNWPLLRNANSTSTANNK